MQRLPGTLFALGLVSLCLTILLSLTIVPAILHKEISKEFRLINGSDLWDQWSNITTASYAKIYLFNVTNPEEVETGGIPKLQEVGPYVYEAWRSKIDVHSYPENDTVFFKEPITFIFSRELSNGTENDLVNILNVPFVAISQALSLLPRVIQVIAKLYLMRFKEKLFLRRTVGEALFKGTYHPIVDELQAFTEKEILPNSTFGFFYGKNGSHAGEFGIYTGIDDVSRFGNLVSWEGKTELNWWNGSYCNMINGTDGTIFPPFLTKESVLRVFAPDLCRSFYMTYKENIEFKGIPGYRYRIPKQLLEDPRVSEDNQCFCIKENLEDCPRAGALRLSACRDGAPIVVSAPHFLDGDPGYAEKIGLTSDRNKHETTFDVEPNTGAVLHINKKVQVNVELKRLGSIAEFKKVQDMLFPCFWVEEVYELNNASAEIIKNRLVIPLRLVEISTWTLTIGSCTLIAAAISIFFVRTRRKVQYV